MSPYVVAIDIIICVIALIITIYHSCSEISYLKEAELEHLIEPMERCWWNGITVGVIIITLINGIINLMAL